MTSVPRFDADGNDQLAVENGQSFSGGRRQTVGRSDEVAADSELSDGRILDENLDPML
jgi:hypothetical protein